MALTNTQYNAIMREYEERQIQHQHLIQKRKEQVYAACPNFKKLEDRMASLAVSQGKLLLAGDKTALVSLKEQLKCLREQKNQYLNQLGFPTDYFEPPYVCPDCKDTGYIQSQKCHCFKQAAIDLVYTQSNIRRILEHENFQNFSFAYYSKENIHPVSGLSSYQYAQQAVESCKDFIEKFDTKFQNLFFYGDTGIGKTFLSNCVAKELLDTGHSVIYFTAFELIRILEQAAFHKGDYPSMDYQNLFDCDLLIIDDLGTEFSNTFTTSQLFLCLNQRILQQKSTIISTNLTINQLAELYSERTFSRITSSYSMLKMYGDDIRILKKMYGK